MPVFAIGEQDGCHYYAMELVEGQSLDRILRDLVEHQPNPLMESTVTRVAAALHPGPRSSSSEVSSTSLSDTSIAGREWFDTVAKLVADALMNGVSSGSGS